MLELIWATFVVCMLAGAFFLSLAKSHGEK